MRRPLQSGIGLAALTAVLSGADAGAAVPVPRITKSTANSVQAAANHRVVTELRAARVLLEKADHDYDGHRAKAVAEVTAAIHILAPGTHHAAAGTTAAGQTTRRQGVAGKKAGGKKAGNKLPQATSDAHLKQAAQILAASQSQLAANSKAAGLVNSAVSEINVALRVR